MIRSFHLKRQLLSSNCSKFSAETQPMNSAEKQVLGTVIASDWKSSNGHRHCEGSDSDEAIHGPASPKEEIQKTAFSLVEMLMALLVASLLLAALAPVMTKRMDEAKLNISGVGAAQYDKDAIVTIFNNDEIFNVPNDVNSVKLTMIGGGGAGGNSFYGKQEVTTSKSWTVPEGVTKLRIFMLGGGGGGASGGLGTGTATIPAGGDGNTYKDFLTAGEHTFTIPSTATKVPELNEACAASGLTAWTGVTDGATYTPGNVAISVTACGGGGGGAGLYSSSNLGGGGGSGGYIRNVQLSGTLSAIYIKIGGGGGGGGGRDGSTRNGADGGYGAGGGGGGHSSSGTVGSSTVGRGGSGGTYGGKGGNAPTAWESQTPPESGSNGTGQSLANPGTQSRRVVSTSYYGGAGGYGGIWGGGGGGGGNCASGGGGGGGPTTITTTSGTDESKIIFQIGGGGGGGAGYFAGGSGGGGGGRTGGGGGGGGAFGTNGIIGYGGAGAGGGLSGMNGTAASNGAGGGGGGGYGGVSGASAGSNLPGSIDTIFGSNYCNGGAGGTSGLGTSGKPGALRLYYTYPELKCDFSLPANGSGGGGAGQLVVGEINVTPGETLYFEIGSGGAVQSIAGKNGNNGNPTRIRRGSSTGVVIAEALGGFAGHYSSAETTESQGGTFRTNIAIGEGNTLSDNWTGISYNISSGSGENGKLHTAILNKAYGGAGGSSQNMKGETLQGGTGGNSVKNGSSPLKESYGAGGGGGSGSQSEGDSTFGIGAGGASGYIYFEYGGSNGGGGTMGELVTKYISNIKAGSEMQIKIGKGGDNVADGKGGETSVQYQSGATTKTVSARGGIRGNDGLVKDTHGAVQKLPSTYANYKADETATVHGQGGAPNNGGVGGYTEALYENADGTWATYIKAKDGTIAGPILGGCGGNLTNIAGGILCNEAANTPNGKNGIFGGGGGGGAVVNEVGGLGGKGGDGVVIIEYKSTAI